jgi:predicted glycogen debranching enzyme
MSSPSNSGAEWLEADRLGGFASGTIDGIRTRRYHALLLTADPQRGSRMVLANGVQVWLETPEGSFTLTSQRYAPDIVVNPEGAQSIASFEPDPWPHWVFELPDGNRIEHGLFAEPGHSEVHIYWRLLQGRGGMLAVRPLLSGRDYHALHHENDAFNFEASKTDGRIVFRPYQGVPAIAVAWNGTYEHRPDWYRNFLYTEERARGLDDVEDLASPGIFRRDLAEGEAVMSIAADEQAVTESLEAIRARELTRRSKFPSRLHRAADAYLVRSGKRGTIIAGYPWFTDWGRDTFIAMRGLCLATGRLDEAREILLGWAGTISEGMLPNRFPDGGGAPEFNAVDASLWYLVAVHEFLSQARNTAAGDRQILESAIQRILDGYVRGTRFGIRCAADGLLAAGAPGVQLTWMDARVGDWVVTPRIGKPVEVQALWLNALMIASRKNEHWLDLYKTGRQAFEARFWDAERGCLHDVVEVDHVQGKIDSAFRPNQILAVGGLPFALLDGERARRVVDAVEARLLTPLGLRSLAQGEPGYAPRYDGSVRERDSAYHQGTVWPWMMGPFVEAWVRVRGGTAQVKREARARFLEPLLGHLDDAGVGHLPEIAWGDPPHAARGCPFQAWSVGEALRLQLLLG